MGVSVWENKWCKNYLKIFFFCFHSNSHASISLNPIHSFSSLHSLCPVCRGAKWCLQLVFTDVRLQFWQQSTSASLVAAAVLRERVTALIPPTETKDSNYHPQTALSSAPSLMLQLTPKHQKAGPGSSHLVVLCCKSSPVHILSLCDITVQFWNLYLQTLISVKQPHLALWGKVTERGCKAVWIDFFFFLSWREIFWAIYTALLNISRSAGFEGEVEEKCILLWKSAFCLVAIKNML